MIFLLLPGLFPSRGGVWKFSRVRGEPQFAEPPAPLLPCPLAFVAGQVRSHGLITGKQADCRPPGKPLPRAAPACRSPAQPSRRSWSSRGAGRAEREHSGQAAEPQVWKPVSQNGGSPEITPQGGDEPESRGRTYHPWGTESRVHGAKHLQRGQPSLFLGFPSPL